MAAAERCAAVAAGTLTALNHGLNRARLGQIVRDRVPTETPELAGSLRFGRPDKMNEAFAISSRIPGTLPPWHSRCPRMTERARSALTSARSPRAGRRSRWSSGCTSRSFRRSRSRSRHSCWPSSPSGAAAKAARACRGAGGSGLPRIPCMRRGRSTTAMRGSDAAEGGKDGRSVRFTGDSPCPKPPPAVANGRVSWLRPGAGAPLRRRKDVPSPRARSGGSSGRGGNRGAR